MAVSPCPALLSQLSVTCAQLLLGHYFPFQAPCCSRRCFPARTSWDLGWEHLCLTCTATRRTGGKQFESRRKSAWAFPVKGTAKKINEVSPEVQRKVEAADKGYILTVPMNQPYLTRLKNQHQLSAEISL